MELATARGILDSLRILKTLHNGREELVPLAARLSLRKAHKATRAYIRYLRRHLASVREDLEALEEIVESESEVQQTELDFSYDRIIATQLALERDGGGER